MRFIFYSIFTLFLFHNICFSQVYFPKNIDEKSLVSKLFEANWIQEDSTFRWIPNLGESIEFSNNLRKDTLRTKIDTLFNYYESGIKKKMILLSTNTYGDICHSCQPTMGIIDLSFDDLKDSLKLESFSKNIGHFGSWGKSPNEKSLQKIKKDKYCLKITEYDSYFGIETGVTSLIIGTEKVYSFVSYISNHDAVEFDREKYSFKSTIQYDAKTDTLRIIKRGKEPNSKGIIIKVHNFTTFGYDERGFFEKISSVNMLKK